MKGVNRAATRRAHQVKTEYAMAAIPVRFTYIFQISVFELFENCVIWMNIKFSKFFVRKISVTTRNLLAVLSLRSQLYNTVCQ